MKIRFDTPPASGQQSQGLAVRYAAAKREVPRWRWYLMLAVIGLPLAYFLARFAAGVWWETAPGFVTLQMSVVRAGAAGLVRDLPAAGSQVQAGATLARIDPPQVLAPAAAPSARAPSPAAPAAARVSARGADVTLALLSDGLRLAERQLAFRRERAAAVDALLQQGAATRAEADASHAAVVQAEAELLRARADIEARRQTLLVQARAEQPAPAPAAPAAEPARPAPPSVMVTSPIDGVVTATLALTGEVVEAGTELLVLQGRQAPMVEAYVAPSDAAYARVGRRATLRFQDGAQMPAVVSEVLPQASRVPAERVGPLSPRSQSIVVRLTPQQELPSAYRIHQLPLDVRFELLWPWNR
jgi:multidrug resistance efflux pump